MALRSIRKFVFFNRCDNLKRTYCMSPYERDELRAKKKTERIIHGESYPEWRTPWADRKGAYYSKLKLFMSETNPSPNVLTFMQKIPDLNMEVVRNWWENLKDANINDNQKFIPERFEALGPNLATAHFITFRGGSIRFKGSKTWLKGDPTKGEISLPLHFDDKYVVEMIDCEGFVNGGLRYVGLDNLAKLHGLKGLSLKGNRHIDDWCIDKIVSQSLNSLEYFNLSDCPKVTHNSLFAISRLTKLKVLIVDCSNIQMEAGLALFEESYPEIIVKANNLHVKEKVLSN